MKRSTGAKSQQPETPLVVATQHTICGLACKTPQLIEVQTMQHDGVDVPMVYVCKSEAWMSRVVSNTHPSKRPLARSTILDELRTQLRVQAPSGDGAQPQDNMQDLE